MLSCISGQASSIPSAAGAKQASSPHPAISWGWSTGLAVAILLTSALFGFTYWKLAATWDSTYDFYQHRIFVQELVERNHVLPHPLFHVLCAIIWQLTRISLESVCYVLVPTVLSGLQAIFIYFCLARAAAPLDKKTALGLAPLAVALSLVAPVNIWSWPHLYAGFLPPTVYHNPTYLTLKPFALFLFVTIVLDVPWRRNTALLCLCTILCGLAKPNYLLSLIVGVPLFWFTVPRQERLSLIRLQVMGVLLPSLLVLGWQYYITYQDSAQEIPSTIVFSPLRAVLSTSPTFIFFKLVSSIAFPLTVVYFFKRQAWEYAPLRFAWLTFVTAALPFYLLAEAGPRVFHGNFAWGPFVCGFILFIASTMFLLNRVRDSWKQRAHAYSICLAVGILHFVCGVVLYACTIRAHSVNEMLFLSLAS